MSIPIRSSFPVLPLVLALLAPACAPVAPEPARCPEVKPAPVVAAAPPPVKGAPAPPTPAASEAPAAPSHCDPVNSSNIDLTFLEKPVGLRKGVGTVSFKVTTASAEAQALFNQGLAYLHSYQWLEAARSFHQALRVDPRLAMAEWGLSRAETGLSENKMAAETIERARGLGAGASARERRYIELLAQQHKAMRALGDEQKKLHAAYKDALDAALADDPSDPEMWVLRGNAEEADPGGRGQRGKMGAVAFYESALARDPHHVGAHHYLVHSYENSGRFADAVAHARVYAADAESVPHAQHMLGHVLPRVGGLKEAVAQFEKAERLHDAYEKAENVRPGDDWHRRHNLDLLGHMYTRLGRLADAEATFRQQAAIPLHDPGWEASRSTLIEFLLLRGRSEEALELSRKLAASPGPGTGPLVGHAMEAEALLQLGRRDEARAAAEASEAARKELSQVKSREATYMLAFYGDDAKQVQAEVDLWKEGPDRDKAEKTLLAMTTEVLDDPSVDGWGSGLFWIERIAAEAKRAGRDALAKSLYDLMQKIDPTYKPGTASAAAR